VLRNIEAKQTKKDIEMNASATTFATSGRGVSFRGQTEFIECAIAATDATPASQLIQLCKRRRVGAGSWWH
jgi:hypothetical protein